MLEMIVSLQKQQSRTLPITDGTRFLQVLFRSVAQKIHGTHATFPRYLQGGIQTSNHGKMSELFVHFHAQEGCGSMIRGQASSQPGTECPHHSLE